MPAKTLYKMPDTPGNIQRWRLGRVFTEDGAVMNLLTKSLREHGEMDGSLLNPFPLISVCAQATDRNTY